jgi:hypothetical protein
VLAVLGAIVLAGLIAGALNLLGVSRANILLAVAVYGAASVLWLPATRRWNGRGHLCWASSLFLFVTYLVFVLDWTLASNLGPLGTERWRRRVTADTPTSALLRRLPAVPQRAQRRDLRRDDGAHPAPRSGGGRRVGRVVHHGGR